MVDITNTKDNPMPCGCGIKATAKLNVEGTRMLYGDAFLEFCPLHRHAAEVLKRYKELLADFNMTRIIMDSQEARDLAGGLVEEGRALIAKAEGRE